MIDLGGKTALVTGASRGIGAAAAEMLARAGASVAINHRNSAANAAEVAGRIRTLGRSALVVQADAADRGQGLGGLIRGLIELRQSEINGGTIKNWGLGIGDWGLNFGLRISDCGID